jgi:hypothetical protein
MCFYVSLFENLFHSVGSFDCAVLIIVDPVLAGEMFRTCLLFCKGDSTGYAILDQFVDAVRKTFPNVIRLPNASECETIASWMFNERGMAGCIGAIDGKHFAVHAGKSDDASFRNYKGYRSITVLGLVNHLYKFTWISDFWPGAHITVVRAL